MLMHASRGEVVWATFSNEFLPPSMTLSDSYSAGAVGVRDDKKDGCLTDKFIWIARNTIIPSPISDSELWWDRSHTFRVPRGSAPS